MQDLFTKPSFIFDIICVAIIVVAALRAAKRGVLATVVAFAGRFISLVVARAFSARASVWVFNTFMAKSFTQRIIAAMGDGVASLNIGGLVEEYAGFLPVSLRNAIVDKFNGTLVRLMQSNAAEVADTIVHDVIAPLMTPVLAIVLFFVAFVVCGMLISLLIALLDKANELPLLGGVNRSLGFVLGALVGVVDVFLLLCILWALMVITGGGLRHINEATLGGSMFYTLFGKINPFV